MDNSTRLGKEKISKLLFQFSVPAIIAMLVNSIYNIVDRMFVGNVVGRLGLAGITICFPVMILIMAYGMLVGIGGASLISIRLGENKKDEAEKILGNGSTLMIVGGLLLGLLMHLFIEPLLTLFGASPDVMPYAVSYLNIILYGTMFQTFSFGMNSYIRAEGNPVISMISMLIGAISNIILDYIFIFHFKMGLQGAALGTILAQAIASIWILRHYFSRKSILHFHLKSLILESKIVVRIMQVGAGMFLMQVASAFVVTIMNRSLKYFGGDVAISAYGIINSITMLFFMPVFGINQGSQPIIGYNYGAKKIKRMTKTIKLAMLAATAVMFLGWLVIMIFPTQLIKLFNKNDLELIELATMAIRYVNIMIPIVGFQIIGTGYFQATGKARQAAFLSLSRQLIFLVPLVLIGGQIGELKGMLIAIPVSDLLSSVLTATFLLREKKKWVLSKE